MDGLNIKIQKIPIYFVLGLDDLINVSLKRQGIKGTSVFDCFGSTTKYPVGTVAKIDYKRKHFYFVAINDINDFGKPIGQSIENVSIALNAVTDGIKRMGHYDNTTWILQRPCTG